MSESIHQTANVSGNPAAVYAALTDGPTFTRLTGAPAEIDAVPGGTFSCFGGVINGRNVELVAGQRVVQAWRVQAWPEGVYSIVRFELEPDGDGTKITLDHGAFPEDAGSHLSAGWETNYWNALRQL